MGFHCGHRFRDFAGEDPPASRLTCSGDLGLRASDADRQRIIDQLRTHVSEGRLTLDEFSDRVGEAYAAKTVGELDHVLRELPAGRAAPAHPRVRLSRLSRRTRRFAIVATWLIVIWLLSGGGYFWPAWPLAFWGLCLFGAWSRHREHHDHDRRPELTSAR